MSARFRPGRGRILRLHSDQIGILLCDLTSDRDITLLTESTTVYLIQTRYGENTTASFRSDRDNTLLEHYFVDRVNYCLLDSDQVG